MSSKQTLLCGLAREESNFNSPFHAFPKQAADAGFVVDWSADFGSMSANGDASTAEATAAPEPPPVGPQGEQGGDQGGGQSWPQDKGVQPSGDTSTCTQDREPTAPGDEVSSWETSTNPILHPSVTGGEEDEIGQGDLGYGRMGQEDRRKSTPGLIFTNEFGEEIEDSTGDRADKWSRSLDGSGSEYETAEEWGDGGQGGGWVSADDEPSYEDYGPLSASEEQGDRATSDPQTISPESDNSGKEIDLTSVYKDHPQTGGQGVGQDSSAKTEVSDLGFASDPFAEPKEPDVFNSDPLQGGGAFESDPFAETQGVGAFESDPFAETQGVGAFESDCFAETQGVGVCESDPSTETQGGGAFESDPLQGGGAFDTDPFAESQGGGAFDVDPFAESQGGGAFESDPLQGGAFDTDPFAETQGGGAFDAGPLQGGGAFDTDPFAETPFGNKGGDFEIDPFAETSGQGGDAVNTEAPSGWDTDPFANSCPPASSRTENPASITSSWQDVSQSGFDSSVTQHNFICGTAAEGKKEVNMPITHKEPENSDMSEDEAANRRFGKLYQELDTEKEEVFTFLPLSI